MDKICPATLTWYLVRKQKQEISDKVGQKKKQSGTVYHITHTHTYMHTYMCKKEKVTKLQMNLKYVKSFIVEKAELI